MAGVNPVADNPVIVPGGELHERKNSESQNPHTSAARSMVGHHAKKTNGFAPADSRFHHRNCPRPKTVLTLVGGRIVYDAPALRSARLVVAIIEIVDEEWFLLKPCEASR